MLVFLRCLSFFLFCSLVVPAAAQDTPLISNVFSETDLRLAIEDVAAQAGVNIIADPSVQGLASVTLEEATVEEALELLLAGTAFQIARTPNYFLIYGADETADLFPFVADTRLVNVENVTAEAARSLLPAPLQRYVRAEAGGNVLAITAPPEILARILSDVTAIDRPNGSQTVFRSLVYVTAEAARSLLPPHLQRFVRADAGRNILAITAPSTSQGEILAQVARLDIPVRPGAQNLPDVHRTKIVKLDNVSALSTLNLLPAALSEYVRADDVSNTLAISAPEPLLSGILDDIATIDVARQHVMLDARVVVLERADLLDFGGEWRWPTLNAGTAVGDAVSWPWELRIGYTPGREFTNALSLTLNMLSQNNEATIIASPQVLAQDGIEAEIRVTTEEYFPLAGQSANNVSASLEKIETGTILRITPQVGGDGTLSLSLEVEVSDVVARGDRNLPVVSRRTARSTVQLESGGTAAVAGLVDTRSQVNRSGVPVLGDLPLLGNAFRTDSLNHRAQQVAVFVTATYVDERGHPVGVPVKAVARVQPTNNDQYRQELMDALVLLGSTF